MWIIKLALRRPYTFIVLAFLLFLISPVMLLRIPVDIFPAINIPVISVIWTYTGLVPSEMSSRIVSIFERSLSTTVNGIEHIESQSLNGVAVVKVFLQPSADNNGAISAVIAESEVGLKQFPPGVTPPLVLSCDASSVPIVQIGLGGKGLNEQQLNNLGVNFIRQQVLQLTIQQFQQALVLNGDLVSDLDVEQARNLLDQTKAQAQALDVQRTQLEHAIAVLEKRHAKLPLEVGDLFAQRRLRNANPARRSAQRALFRNRFEVTHVPKFHSFILSVFSIGSGGMNVEAMVTDNHLTKQIGHGGFKSCG